VFKNQGTADVFAGTGSKAARKVFPSSLHALARRKLLFLIATRQLSALAVQPGNRLELLVGDRKGDCSIRINERYRICFAWTERGADGIEIVDYH
jgi:proteic killer suppression protein